MSLKRTLLDFNDRTWSTSTSIFTQAGNGLMAGQVGIFWPLTADGTFGGSISTSVTGFEVIFTDGTTETKPTLPEITKAGFTLTLGAIDKGNATRLLTVANTGSLGIVQINVVQEDLPWTQGPDPMGSIAAMLTDLTGQIAALEARVAALEP